MDVEPRTGTRARSFEQDLLWSVLDGDAVPHVVAMARERWGVGAAAAWDELVRQGALGRLRAYRGTGPYEDVDLSRADRSTCEADHGLVLEATEGTLARLNEIAASGATAA